MSSAAAATGGSWGLALRLARRELRGGLRGFGVFLACLALGVAAIAVVGTVSGGVLDALRDDGRRILGGDMDLRLVHRPANQAQLDWLNDRAEVALVIDMRAMGRAPGPDGRRALIELRGIGPLYPLYGAAELAPAGDLADALARRDGVWGAVAEPALLRRLDLEVGDTLQVGELTYELRADLAFEPDRAAKVVSFGPHVLVARDSLPETDLIQPGSLVHYHYRLRLPAGSDLTVFRADLNVAFPDAGWRIRGPDQAAPGVTRFVERLSLYLTLVGLTALLVGGLGVANAVNAYLEGRAATIATLKCLGAPGRLIFRTYMAQIMLLALLGIGIGLALGASAPFAAAGLLSDLLGWQIAMGVQPLALARAAAFGLLTAFAFSLWPLARARWVPGANLFRDTVAPFPTPPWRAERRVLAVIGLAGLALAGLAISSAADRWLGLYFVLGAGATLAVFRLAGYAIVALARRVPRPRRTALRLALANLHRPGAPTGSVVASLGLGLTVLVAIALVEANLARQLRDELPLNAPGFYFIDIQPDQMDDFTRLVEAHPGARDLQRVPMLRGRIAAVNGTPSERLNIPPDIAWVFRGDRGLTWSAAPPDESPLVAGDWWPLDYNGAPLVSLDAEVGRLMGIGPGDRLSINILGREVEVEIANLRVIDWSQLGINFVMVFSPGLLESAPQTFIATLRADQGAEDDIERAVTDRFANVSSIRVKEVLAMVTELLGHIAAALRVAGAVALAAGVLVLAGAVAAGHRRRIYDAVVLKVLGARRADVARAFLAEYGLLGGVTSLIAGAIGSLAGFLILTEVMHMPFVFLPQPVIATALGAAVITLAFGFAGTWRALGQKAAPLLRNH